MKLITFLNVSMLIAMLAMMTEMLSFKSFYSINFICVNLHLFLQFRHYLYQDDQMQNIVLENFFVPQVTLNKDQVIKCFRKPVMIDFVKFQG